MVLAAACDREHAPRWHMRCCLRNEADDCGKERCEVLVALFIRLPASVLANSNGSTPQPPHPYPHPHPHHPPRPCWLPTFFSHGHTRVFTRLRPNSRTHARTHARTVEAMLKPSLLLPWGALARLRVVLTTGPRLRGTLALSPRSAKRPSSIRHRHHRRRTGRHRRRHPQPAKNAAGRRLRLRRRTFSPLRGRGGLAPYHGH